MNIWNFLFVTLLISGCAHRQKDTARTPQSTKTELILEKIKYQNQVVLRTGTMPESKDRNFKACVLYLQGLGDSIRNHEDLFQSLSQAGYRVITYDYMGQGESSGLMNSTRLDGSSYKQIGNQARWLWDYRSKETNLNSGSSCAKSKKFVIGWSTGGLAAYKLAFENWPDAVVLIAPGIHPKLVVGEAATNFTKAFHTITERTLTRNHFSNGPNPHIDKIKPDTPLKVPRFAASLLLTAKKSQSWQIDNRTKGLVFLSGTEDSYVDREATIKTLSTSAHHFDIVSYDGALHELDNELPEVSTDLRNRILNFFDQVLLQE